jgi:CheY-like chemotaxis protein
MIQTNPGEVPGGAESIVKAAHRGKSLISQILTFSRQVKLAKTRVELGSLAQEIEQLIRVTLPQNIALSVNVSGDAPVIADAGQMSQVVMNLCTNAVYAMKDKGGELRVEVASIPTGFVGADRISKLAGVGTDVVMLRVSDTGGGIPPAVKDRIFEPFFSTKPVGDGSGLGLSVVLGIVEAHGGQIHLDSTVGVGTVFELYFPKAAEISAELTPSEESTTFTAPTTGSEHIVLVDDESMVLEVSAAALRQRGYTVSAFTEPEKVLEALGNGSFTGDILVTDLTMPRVTGIELARRLVAVYPDFPVILCSGYDLSGEDGTRDDSAVSARISKPYSIGELVTLVRKTLDERRSKESQRVSNQ